ncbi:MAG: UDP-galactopyranose mutase [Eubacterium sp.]|nr:UDP-galactopyranose mutase [Eubacterium sp.]
MYDSIVIGAGIAGSVTARQLAEKGNQKVLVVEKRDHIGGNCYDRPDDYGILVHEYGPHIFHTNMEDVFAFLSRFTEWNLYENGHQVVANVDGRLIPVPFNLNTLHMVYEKDLADTLEKKLIDAYGEGSRVPIMKLRENPDPQIQAIAQYVYENVFLKYTMKQWGQTPDEISPEVTGRVPVLISYDNRYFQDQYQGVPADSFTEMFARMLDHENITVRTGTDAKEILEFGEETIRLEGQEFKGHVIFTGALDELYDCRYGRLPYRSLRFAFEHLAQDDFQDGHSVVNYTVSEDFTRITEFKYLTRQKDTDGTTIIREYPFAYTGAPGEIPYYAIMNPDNQALYQKYKALADRLTNMHLLGRLAEYQYYNIDVMTKKALELADKLI